MKTKEELNAIKAEVETVSKKLHELTEEELKQVNGGIKVDLENEDSLFRNIMDWFFKIKK